MASQTSRVMEEEEDTRGGGGCFGWLRKLFRSKKRERRAKRKEAEPSLTPADSDDVPSTYLQNNRVTEISEGNDPDVGEERQKDEEKEPKVAVTWAEEVDEAEEKGLDVFAPEIGCLPHTASVHCETTASPENEATVATTESRMSACQKRKARRRALRAAMKASAENEASSTTNSEEIDTRVSASDEPPFVAEAAAAEAAHSGTSATKRRRARRKAVASRIRSEARLAATSDRASVWPSPSVRVYGSEGRPFVTTWEEAAYGAFHAQRHG